MSSMDFKSLNSQIAYVHRNWIEFITKHLEFNAEMHSFVGSIFSYEIIACSTSLCAVFVCVLSMVCSTYQQIH